MFNGDFCDRIEPIDVMEEEVDNVSSGPYRWNCQIKSLGESQSARIHDCIVCAHLTSIDCLFEA